MKKTSLVLVLTVSAMMAVTTACGGQSSPAPAATTAAAAATTAAAAQEAAAPAGDVKGIEAGMCETPAVLTSIGQSADVDIVNTILSKAGIAGDVINATASFVSKNIDKDGYKQLIYRGIIKEHGQKMGLELYRLIKGVL